MSRKLLFKLILCSLVSIAVFSYAGQAKASASTRCGVMAIPNKISSPTPFDTDCLLENGGQAYHAFTSLSGTSDELKTQFIHKMVNFDSSKINYLRLGAKYLEDRIGNDRMTWDVRLKQPDITLSLESYTYYSNSAYDTVNNNIIVYDAYLPNTPTLVFRVSGVIYLVIKIDCGNPVDIKVLVDPIPPLPFIEAYKLSDDPFPYSSPASTDTVIVSVGPVWARTTQSDNRQPSGFYIPTEDNVVVSVADAVSNYKVVSYSVLNCSLKQSICSNSSPPPGKGASLPFFAKYDHEYTVFWYYQKIKPATITGNVVDTSGNIINPTGFSISATNSSSGGTVYSSSNPFILSVTPGDISATASITDPKYTLVGAVKVCDTKTDPSCVKSTKFSPLDTITATENISKTESNVTYIYNWVYKSVCTGSSCIPTDCPPFLNPIVTVDLTDKTPVASAPGKSTTIPNYTYLQVATYGTTKVTAVNDESVKKFGGSSVVPKLNSPTINVIQSSNKAVLDYSPYIKAYPFDLNQPSVSYTNFYKVTPYKSASTPSSYTCDNGYPPDANHKCTTVISNPACNQGGSWNGTNCGSYPAGTPHSSGGRYYCYRDGYYQDTSTCSSNGSIYEVSISGGITTYTCDSGSGAGSTAPNGSNCGLYPFIAGQTALVNATAWYDYTVQPSYDDTIDSVALGTIMPACFDRNFSVSSINSSAANITLNNYENPTSVTPSGFTATVKFSYPSAPAGPTLTSAFKGLRQAMKAVLNYSYKFYKNSNPSSTQLCSSNNNQFTVDGPLGEGASVPDPSIVPSKACNVSVGLAASQVVPGDQLCAIYSVSSTGSKVNVDGKVTDSNGGTVASTEKCSSPVVNDPYFKVFGGDVLSGGSIFGWNTGTQSAYTQINAGAGSQFSIFPGTGTANGFASNQNNINKSPTGLSFSNSNTSGQIFATLFGSFNTIGDYYSSLPPAGADVIRMSSGTINTTLLSPRQNTIIYATGNIYIKGDIKESSSSYGSISEIPKYILIVKGGNIYIDSGVKNLYGIYIAQPSSTSSLDGYIYDCSNGTPAAYANNQLYEKCGNQLTVNGSFIANKVFLNRTGDASSNKLTSSLRSSNTNETSASSHASEIFNYGPAFWMNLSIPQATSTGVTSAGYDSIINLPPIL